MPETCEQKYEKIFEVEPALSDNRMCHKDTIV